jgi:hypothetical protein
MEPVGGACLQRRSEWRISAIGRIVSRLICKEGVYHALAKGFIERASPILPEA